MLTLFGSSLKSMKERLVKLALLSVLYDFLVLLHKPFVSFPVLSYGSL